MASGTLNGRDPPVVLTSGWCVAQMGNGTSATMTHRQLEIAGWKRKCYRSKTHSIVKGDTCLVVKDGPQTHRRRQLTALCARQEFWQKPTNY